MLSYILNVVVVAVLVNINRVPSDNYPETLEFNGIMKFIVGCAQAHLRLVCQLSSVKKKKIIRGIF